jgi:hypothetical protein
MSPRGEKRLLKRGLVLTRLKQVSSRDKAERLTGMFGNGTTRPDKKRLYRKETAFQATKPNVSNRTTLPGTPTVQEIRGLATVNKRLASVTPPSEAIKDVESKFVVAQNRGLFPLSRMALGVESHRSGDAGIGQSGRAAGVPDR